jgi:hypothetical protein
MTEFVQWVNSKRIYHADHESIDGSDFPLTSKPVWTLTQTMADGSPGQVGTLETSPDGHTARLTTGPLPGTITATVTAVGETMAVATTTFIVNVAKHPPITGSLKVSQHRNGPTH